MYMSASLRIRASTLGLLVLLGCAFVAAPATASPPVDHERARRAVQSGAILPLPVVLERLARVQPGQVMEVELEEDHGQWIYEIKLLNSSGQLSKLKLDARSAAILRMKPADARLGPNAPR
ncbi:MAG: peptidase [Burkholderiaceae bacterium]|nr:peptidase [Burkholderiaceae bacterium]